MRKTNFFFDQMRKTNLTTAKCKKKKNFISYNTIVVLNTSQNYNLMFFTGLITYPSFENLHFVHEIFDMYKR